METIGVYCGSSLGDRPEYAAVAVALVEACAARGLSLVYGGDHAGLMGVVADAALERDVEVIGVLPAIHAHDAHRGLADVRIVPTIHERKATMAALADGFVALPGGLGTLEEFAEAVTWSQLGLHAKPTGLVNVASYFDALLAFFDHAAASGFVSAASRSLVLADTDPGALLDAMAAWRPTPGKWAADGAPGR